MILVVDDDKNIRLSLKLVLERNGYEVTLAGNPKEAIQMIRTVPAVELVLMDMNYSLSTDGEEGLTLLRQIKVFRPEVPCILMTAWGTIDLAVQGMRAGIGFHSMVKSQKEKNLHACHMEVVLKVSRNPISVILAAGWAWRHSVCKRMR